MMIGSQELIRDINRRLVLKTIINNPPMSRADLAKRLNLTKATISYIVQDLIIEHLVTEIGSGDTAMGRKPILLDFCSGAGWAVAIDIGVHQINALTSDLRGENCSVKEFPLVGYEKPMEAIKKILHETIDNLPPAHYGVIGISVGIYGVVWENEVLFTPYYHLSASQLATALASEFGVPVRIENDANLAVLGESAFFHTNKNMIYINVHDGIGMGILIDGQLYTGYNGHAGELGHTILFPHGRPCPCGNNGCLEQYASEKAILADYAKKVKRPSVTISDFLKSYQLDETEAVSSVNSFTAYMGIAVNNILNTFNADLIIINSSFTNYIPSLNTAIQDSLRIMQNQDYQILSSRLQDLSALMGGIRVSIENFLDIRELHFTLRTDLTS